MKKCFALGLTLTLLASPAWAVTPEKIVWLTTSQQIKTDLPSARRAAKGASFHYFALDESNAIMTHFEEQFPKKMIGEPSDVKNAYLKEHIAPKLKAYSVDIMRSEMGASLAKLYRVDKIPAVVINDKYVTYGMSVKASIEALRSAKR